MTPVEYKVSVLSPPYHRVTSPHMAVGELPRGTVILLGVGAPPAAERSRQRLRAKVTRFRARFGCSVVLLVSPAMLRAYPDWSIRLQGLGTRRILLEREHLEPAVWSMLSQPSDLGGEWVEWLRLRREVSEEAAVIIRVVVDRALEAADLRVLLQTTGLSPRSSRATLRREGLPSPGRFRTAAKILKGHLWLQRDAALTVERAAWQLGYADHSGFTQGSRRLFGESPDMARRLLGLEWRFDEWWETVT